MPDILLLDDEPDLLDILKPEFEDAGFEVESFTKPEEALSSIKFMKYDLVISDIRMPKMDGMEVMLNSKKLLTAAPEFVFYTGFSDYSDADLLNAGALKVFKKPLNFDEFFNFIESYLKQAS